MITPSVRFFFFAAGTRAVKRAVVPRARLGGPVTFTMSFVRAAGATIDVVERRTVRVRFRPPGCGCRPLRVGRAVAAPAQHGRRLPERRDTSASSPGRDAAGPGGVRAELAAGGEVAVLGVDDGLDLALAGHAAGGVELDGVPRPSALTIPMRPPPPSPASAKLDPAVARAGA